jgi:hypothetical protein
MLDQSSVFSYTALSPEAFEVWSMVSGLPFETRSRWRMTVLQAFVDDSGSDLKGPVYVLSGYVSTVERWAVFSDAWKAKLQEKPSISFFKMSEANSRKGQFLGWDQAEVDRKVVELAAIIPPHVICNVTCMVKQADYNAVVLPMLPRIAVGPGFNAKELAKAMEDPYWFCFYMWISYYLEDLEVNGGLETVDFYFDNQNETGKRALAFWDNVKSWSPEKYQSAMKNIPVFRDEKDFLPLQAADMMAWTARRAFDEGCDISAIKPGVAPLLMVRTIPVNWDGAKLKDMLTPIVARLAP